MRLIAAPELRTVLTFQVGRIARSTLRQMQVADRARRHDGAALAARGLMPRVSQWDVFLHDGPAIREVDDRERRQALVDVLAAIPLATIRDLASGHQATHAAAAAVVVAELERRFAAWVILVPEADGSAFSAAPAHLPWEPYEA